MVDYFWLLPVALSNLFCGMGIGYLCGIMKERNDWKLKLATKGILPSNWHRVRVETPREMSARKG